MELTSIEASFYKCPNAVNTVLEVVWRDVGNIPDEERQALTALHQTIRVMGKQFSFMHYTELIDRQWTDGQWLNFTLTPNLKGEEYLSCCIIHHTHVL
jgi:hypothetical protein